MNIQKRRSCPSSHQGAMSEMMKTFVWSVVVLLLVSGGCCLADPDAEAMVVEGPIVTEGDSIMLSCAVYNVSGGRAKSFRMEWRREGVVLTRGKRVLSPDNRYRVTMIDGVSDRRDFVLHIDNVNRSDAGQYVCWVIVRSWYPNIPDKRVTSRVDLTVRYFPRHPRCHHNGRSEVFLAGTEVELTCSVQEGEPTVRTRWKGANDMVLFAHETHHDGYVTNVLEFLAMPEHNGMVFTCKVTSDAFPGITSTCRIGPIEVMESGSIVIDPDSAGSFIESSIEDNNREFSELAPIPVTTRKSASLLDTNTATVTETQPVPTLPHIPLIDTSENACPIKESALAKKLTVVLLFFVILLLISAMFNAFLYAKLRRLRKPKADCGDDGNHVVSSLSSGVSNQEYMDMGNHNQLHHDGQFYATISRQSSTSNEADYDNPRQLSATGQQSSSEQHHTGLTSVGQKSSDVQPPTGQLLDGQRAVGQPYAAPSRTRDSSNYRNSIYQNLGGRPITPPRSKRKSVLMQEHVV